MFRNYFSIVKFINVIEINHKSDYIPDIYILKYFIAIYWKGYYRLW